MVAILHPVGPGVQIPIDRAVVLIGRSPECDAVIDVSSKISRMHCALVQVDADYYIRDLGSMNGVTVAGQRIEKDLKLTNGVEVMIGDVKFLFLENVAPPVRTARPVTAGSGRPVLIDESADVLDLDEVGVIEPVAPRRPPAKASPPPFVYPTTARGPGPGSDRRQKLSPDIIEIEEVEVVEADILDDVDVVELADDVIDVVEDVEVIEDVEIIEEVEVIEDVEVVDDKPRRRRPPRLR